MSPIQNEARNFANAICTALVTDWGLVLSNGPILQQPEWVFRFI
jgi:hypothetical protein